MIVGDRTTGNSVAKSVYVAEFFQKLRMCIHPSIQLGEESNRYDDNEINACEKMFSAKIFCC
jgi:hypothetical protein